MLARLFCPISRFAWSLNGHKKSTITPHLVSVPAKLICMHYHVWQPSKTMRVNRFPRHQNHEACTVVRTRTHPPCAIPNLPCTCYQNGLVTETTIRFSTWFLGINNRLNVICAVGLTWTPAVELRTIHILKNSSDFFCLTEAGRCLGKIVSWIKISFSQFFSVSVVGNFTVERPVITPDRVRPQMVLCLSKF